MISVQLENVLMFVAATWMKLQRSVTQLTLSLTRINCLFANSVENKLKLPPTKHQSVRRAGCGFSWFKIAMSGVNIRWRWLDLCGPSADGREASYPPPPPSSYPSISFDAECRKEEKRARIIHSEKGKKSIYWRAVSALSPPRPLRHQTKYKSSPVDTAACIGSDSVSDRR